MKRRIALAAAACLALPAWAQTPAPGPLRWIVPYAPGGATDTLARTLAEGMQAALGQSIYVENRPGAATNIGVQALLQAKPDGTTVMNAENAALFFNEHMFPRLPYKPERDFSYVGAIGRVPVLLAVHPDFPARTLQEFISQARAQPGKVSYASPGIGTSHHMAMELLQQHAGIKLTHVAYKGGAQAITDVVGGHMQAMVLDLTVGNQYIKAGKLRPLAVAAQGRVSGLPQVPTFAELGLKEVVAYTVHGLIGPAGMPEPAVARLNAALQAAVKTPKFTALMADTGFEPLPGSGADFRSLARSESARWGKVIKATGVQLD